MSNRTATAMTDLELLLDDISELENEIDRLYREAESGEQFAHICLLEKRLNDLQGDYWRSLQDDGQFGVGA